jgi:hypothetical protein
MHVSPTALALTLALSAGPAAPTPPPGKAAKSSPADTAQQQAAEKKLKALAASDGGEELPTDLSPLIDILSTSDGGFPIPRYRWNVPDLQGYVDVPVVQFINGLPVRFNAAMSKHDVPYLMDFYAKEFIKAGLYIPPPDTMNGLGLGDRFFQLTGLDTDNLISYSVIFQPIDDHSTTVIMGQGYLQEWLKRKPQTTDFAPLYPQAAQVVRTHTEGMELINYTTPSPATLVYGFYDDVMPKAGYAKLGNGVYVRGQERIQVRAGRGKPDSPVTGVMVERRLISPDSPALP